LLLQLDDFFPQNNSLVGKVVQIADIISSESSNAITQKLLQLILADYLPFRRRDVSHETWSVFLQLNLQYYSLMHFTHFDN